MVTENTRVSVSSTTTMAAERHPTASSSDDGTRWMSGEGSDMRVDYRRKRGVKEVSITKPPGDVRVSAGLTCSCAFPWRGSSHAECIFFVDALRVGCAIVCPDEARRGGGDSLHGRRLGAAVRPRHDPRTRRRPAPAADAG